MRSTRTLAPGRYSGAEQCRRLASGILNDQDAAVAALLALAVEFEAKAVALTAEQASEKQVEQIDQNPNNVGSPDAPP